MPELSSVSWIPLYFQRKKRRLPDAKEAQRKEPEKTLPTTDAAIEWPTDHVCLFPDRCWARSVLARLFSPYLYLLHKKNAIDKHRSLNRRGFYLFRFFRSLIIYSSTERRRDNEVISMSLTFNSKPSLLLLILVLFFFLLFLPTDEYMNRNEQSSRKRTGTKNRRTSSTGYPGNRKGNHPLLTVSHCNNLGWCHFSFNHSNDDRHFCKQPTHPSVRPSPSIFASFKIFITNASWRKCHPLILWPSMSSSTKETW